MRKEMAVVGIAILALAIVIVSTTRVARAEEPIYTYTDAHGRQAFVSGLDEVPPQFRAKAKKVDVSKVDLNQDLGNKIRDRTDEDYDALKQAEKEQKEREAALAAAAGTDGTEKIGPTEPPKASDAQCPPPEADGPIWEVAWKRYPAPVTALAMCLALLLATPWMYKRMSMPWWNKTLAWAIPLFMFLGFIGQVAVAASRGARTVKAIMAGRVCANDERDVNVRRI